MQMSHFKAKMHQIRFLASVRLSVRPFVRSFVRASFSYLTFNALIACVVLLRVQMTISIKYKG